MTTRGSETSRLLGFTHAVLEAMYLERDSLRLELLHYRSLGSEAARGVRPVNLVSLTHRSLIVSELETTLA